jgi:hypothetical protein
VGSDLAVGFEAMLPGNAAVSGGIPATSRTSSGLGAAALISSDSGSSLAGACLGGSDRGSSNGSNGGKAPISNQKYYGFGLSRASSFGSQMMSFSDDDFGSQMMMNGFNSFGIPALQLPTQA